MTLMAPDTVHSPEEHRQCWWLKPPSYMAWLYNQIKQAWKINVDTLGLNCDVTYRRFTNQPILETSISLSTTIGAVVLRTHYMIKFNSDPNEADFPLKLAMVWNYT